MAFPLIAAYSRGAPFMMFAAVMALQFAVVLALFPETKRRSLEAIETAL